jgi:peptidoglycan/LPS O-acetylase OafA/YrhL
MARDSEGSSGTLGGRAGAPNSVTLSGQRRIASVQGLRGLAVIVVILFHAGLPLPGGFLGVDVFFVISGYVIARLLMSELAERNKIRFGNFYARRIRRLLPAFAVMTSAVLVMSILIESPIQVQSETAKAGGFASVWLANVAMYMITTDYFALGVKPALLHTWSLAVEEQFYLMFPALIGFAWWVGRRAGSSSRRAPRVSLGVAIALASVVSFLINLWLCFAPPPVIPAPLGVAFFFPMGRAWEFGLGALVAVALRRRHLRPATANGLASVGLLLVVASLVLVTEGMAIPGVVVVPAVVGAAMVIAGTVEDSGWVGRLFSSAPAVAVGDLSYSLYLWHWPFVVWAQTLWGQGVVQQSLAALVSVPVAIASYRYVEQPIRSGRRAAWPTPLLVAPCIAIPLALSLVLSLGAARYWGDSAIASSAAQMKPRFAAMAGCMNRTPVDKRDLGPCTHTFGPGDPVILMGDSNAAQYGGAVLAAGEDTRRTVVLTASAGCSINLVEIEKKHQGSAGCLRLAQGAVDYLKKLGGTPTVLMVSANEVVDDERFVLIDPRTGERAGNTAGKARIWERGLIRTYTELTEAGVRVINVTAMPHFVKNGVTWGPWECRNRALHFDVDSCGQVMSLAEGNRRHAAGLQAEENAVAATGVEVLDLRDEICPNGTCSTNHGNFWVYREGMHLTVSMADRLAPQFDRAMR